MVANGADEGRRLAASGQGPLSVCSALRAAGCSALQPSWLTLIDRIGNDQPASRHPEPREHTTPSLSPTPSSSSHPRTLCAAPPFVLLSHPQAALCINPPLGPCARPVPGHPFVSCLRSLRRLLHSRPQSLVVYVYACLRCTITPFKQNKPSIHTLRLYSRLSL